jgi:hypothetical protein
MFVHRLTPGSLGLSRLAQQMIHRTLGEQGVFLVGTATVATASLHAAEGKQYRPELLLQPQHVAAVVLNALS